LKDCQPELSRLFPGIEQLIVNNNNNIRTSTNPIISDYHIALSKIPIIDNTVLDVDSLQPSYNQSRQELIMKNFTEERFKDFESTLINDPKKKTIFYVYLTNT
jgi:hypothetical protein